MDVLISAAELSERLADVRALDVRWTVMQPDGHPAYLQGHLPGAVFVNLDTDLADHAATGRGRHPLPSPEAFQASARGWGLNDGDAVVVYDDWNSQAASRAWWLLRAAGVSDVRILDGGWAAWQRFGGATEAGEASSGPGDITVTSLDGLDSVDINAVATQARSQLVLDARASARYRGDEEPLDPRAGHIPGAISAPTAENLNADGTFRPPAELRERFQQLGVEQAPVTVYCGSGVTATHQIAALAIAGYEGVLYPGSWSEWSSDPQRPVTTGPDPS
ncbi:sulfurtransferase [Mycobacterium sp. CBMA271]|uniref:sulfurtransferase n=1 Tax=unclassified Mycobacteroides TaxID=2618759 RepID=UPI0012DEF7A6|nr:MULTISPECIES: sulfurtransferase [unclassified Mycobacteroides]MUM18116.1 thiosulfate sulfurtransferase [Mycobacteroides sp. CBMA 326]MUM23399.1 sulfurtransferase [Mycobacteroides sp. CBMA 271]